MAKSPVVVNKDKAELAGKWDSMVLVATLLTNRNNDLGLEVVAARKVTVGAAQKQDVVWEEGAAWHG